jgi:hypothetical protein
MRRMRKSAPIILYAVTVILQLKFQVNVSLLHGATLKPLNYADKHCNEPGTHIGHREL